MVKNRFTRVITDFNAVTLLIIHSYVYDEGKSMISQMLMCEEIYYFYCSVHEQGKSLAHRYKRTVRLDYIEENQFRDNLIICSVAVCLIFKRTVLFVAQSRR